MRRVYTVDNLPAVRFAPQTTGAVLCGHIVAAAILRGVYSLYITRDI